MYLIHDLMLMLDVILLAQEACSKLLGQVMCHKCVVIGLTLPMRVRMHLCHQKRRVNLINHYLMVSSIPFMCACVILQDCPYLPFDTLTASL